MEQVTLNDGRVVNASEAIYLQTGYYVWKYDIGLYGTDAVTGLHYPRSYMVWAHAMMPEEVLTLLSDCVVVGSDHYHTRYLRNYDIICTVEGDYMYNDDAYLWDSDGEYHSHRERAPQGSLWDYSAGPREKDLRNGAKFGFGVEIEKNALPSFNFDKEEFYDLTGAVLERDGSVCRGFELKTPIYDLFGADTEQRLYAFKPYCDITNNENAGGHIGFSVRGKNDEQVLNGVRGFLPLIYAMYPSRVRNSYCRGKNVNDLKQDREKMQAVNLRGSYIEFRIFPAVWNYDTLLFRFRLMQLIAKRYGRSFFAVITELVTEGTELNTLFRTSVYANNDKFLQLVQRSIDNDRRFGTNKLTAARIADIEAALRATLAAKATITNNAEPHAGE